MTIEETERFLKIDPEAEITSYGQELNNQTFAIAKISTTCKKPGDIKWNLTKFLVAKDGTVVKRYDPTSDPKTFAADIEALL